MVVPWGLETGEEGRPRSTLPLSRQAALPRKAGRPTPAHRQPIPHAASGDDRLFDAPVQILSWHPRAFYLPAFIDPASASALAAFARPRMVASGLALKPGERETDARIKAIRTSSGTFLNRADDPTGVLELLETRAAAVTHLPVSHGEAWNVLGYEKGQHYHSHYDSFDPAAYGAQPSQRVATLLVYLTDVSAGGETFFPLEGEHSPTVPTPSAAGAPFDFAACAGLKVGPARAGDALLFYSLHPNGTADGRSLHGGCDVGAGAEKVVATKWLRTNVVA
jgi:prolyl 4-hydroxylase